MTGRGHPAVPGLDAPTLVRHIGGIFAWVAAIVSTAQRVGIGPVGSGPERSGDLPQWYPPNLSGAVHALTSTDALVSVWTFSTTLEITGRCAGGPVRVPVMIAVLAQDQRRGSGIVQRIVIERLEGRRGSRHRRLGGVLQWRIGRLVPDDVIGMVNYIQSEH